MKPKNRPTLPEALPGDLGRWDRPALEGELYALLEERAARYTMGDSSSLRVQTAESLLRGILFCISLACKARPAGGQATARELFDAGLTEAERMARRGRLLLKQAEAFPPPVTNQAYRDTLSFLPGFFKRYDPAFLSAEIPCDIDYPLCQPVLETQSGIEYFNTYLRRILAENGFLRRFDKERLTGLYERYIGDYEGLLVNLYAPAAEAAVGCVLVGRPVRELTASRGEQAAACQRLAGLSVPEAEKALEQAAAEVCGTLDITGQGDQDYIARAAQDLLPRIRACAAANTGEGVLPSA